MVNVVNTCCWYVWFAGSVYGRVDLGHAFPILYICHGPLCIMCLRVHWYLNHGFGNKKCKGHLDNAKTVTSFCTSIYI